LEVNQMTPLTRSVGLAALASFAALAQPASAPAFEVASVKVDTVGTNEGAGRGREVISTDAGSLTMKNVPLRSAILWAYHLFPYQVTGPAWLDTDRFAIDAKTGGPTSEEDRRKMLQTLLAERFKLTFHRETKDLGAYVVTVGKNGPKFKESEGEGEMEMKPNGRAGITLRHATMAELADLLNNELMHSPFMVQRVIDQTGLKGHYDISIDMSSVMGVGTPIERTSPGTPGGPEEILNIIIGAVQDQLGLKFEIKKTAVEILVIDHAEKVPVEN
jgi:uncharacterized protein (TIGR03435 family)